MFKTFFSKVFFVCSILLISTLSNADCTVQCPITQDNVWSYYSTDHFQWTNYDDDVHMLIGFGGAVVIGEALTHYGKLPAWQSAIIGAIVMGMVGTFKETMLDTYTSKTDIKTWWIGGISGGVTVVALHF